MVKVMGADHVMYAIDYPYMKPDNVSDETDKYKMWF